VPPEPRVLAPKKRTNIRSTPDGTIHYLELFKAELTTSFYLEPFPFDTESLEMFVEPLLDERDTMTLEYDNQVATDRSRKLSMC